MNYKIFVGSLPFIAGLLLSSCIGDKSACSFSGEWCLSRYNPLTVSSYGLCDVEGNEYRLRLNPAGTFSFTTDCNTISGSFKNDGAELYFPDISFTELACPEMDVENSLKANLSQINYYELRADTVLILKDKAGHVLLELKEITDRRQE